ncbi:hypothetical protein [Ruegeria sp. Ofav3-42]|uniref:hypothetical protein n=1 Tax=Ruegeria sp. Ofav3-42 TaxID=2917759 RepID=UPI001EF5C236|nr:hypothetical protein [Ruegeria sp. Ofav3-42]MCG7522235.1 hypothetical protein [Ruegeria sp. Ofav3-42]
MSFRNWFASFSFPLIGAAASLSIAIEVSAGSLDGSAEASCETTWQNLVSGVEELISTDVERGHAIVFAGQDGHIFNCLDQALADSVIQELQFWEIARSRTIASDPLYDDSHPPNFCNSSYGTVRGMQIMIIHLPYDAGKFASHTCTVRLRGIPDRVKQFLQTE